MNFIFLECENCNDIDMRLKIVKKISYIFSFFFAFCICIELTCLLIELNFISLLSISTGGLDNGRKMSYS